MPEIKIKIRDKRAGGTGTVICGNSDYTVVWALDNEWTPYGTKTMRVNLADGSYQDVVFTGSTAALPVLPSVTTPGGGCVRSAHGKAQSADCGAAGERRPGGGGLSDGAPGGLVHAGGGRIHPVFRRWEKLGQCGGSGQSEGTQGRYRPARPRRVRRQRDGFLHCRRNGPVGAVRRRPDCGRYRRGGRTPCPLEEKNRRHPERPGLRGQG